MKVRLRIVNLGGSYCCMELVSTYKMTRSIPNPTGKVLELNSKPLDLKRSSKSTIGCYILDKIFSRVNLLEHREVTATGKVIHDL